MTLQEVRRLLSRYEVGPGRRTMTLFFGSGDAAVSLDRVTREQQALIFLVHDGAGTVTLPPDSTLFHAAVDDPALPELWREVFLHFRIEEGFQLHTACGPGGERLLERCRNTVMSLLSDLKFQRESTLILWRCLLRNLPRIAASADPALPTVSPDASVLICGAGPSLAADMAVIRRYRDRFHLIGVGHAWARLAAFGIMPDLVTEIDPDSVYLAAAADPGDIPLAAVPLTAPAAVARFRRTLWLADPDPVHDRFLRRKGIVLPPVRLSRSVMVTAIDLAIRCGYRRIALIGSELCLGTDGSIYGGPDSSTAVETVELPGNDVPRVVSTPNLTGIHASLESYLSTAPVKVVNCTPGGARIAGTGRDTLAGWAAASGSVTPWRWREPPLRAGVKAAMAAVGRSVASGGDAAAEVLDGIAAFVSRTVRESVPGHDFSHLADDLRFDLASDPVASGSAAAEPWRYAAFRRFAVDCIRRTNSEYADWLEAEAVDGDDGFTVRNWLSSLPQVALAAGGTVLTPGDNREHAAYELVRAFAERHRLDPRTDAVVLVAPGDWQAATELMRCYPALPVLVADPHPRLFRRLISHAMFLHWFAPDTLFAGIDAALPGWRRLIHGRLRDWKRAGRRTLLLVHPELEARKEVKAAVALISP